MSFIIVVKGDDFFLDLLFYNFNLHCFVIFELKIGEFEPEFAGKLNFYVNTVNAQLKGKEDKPTIGVLLCKTPNETVVKYSLQGIQAPIGVADYKLSKALPAKLKGEIPTVEELEAEMDKEYEELKNPSQKRLDALKEKLSQLKVDEIKQTATTPILFEIFDKSLLPLFEAIIKRMMDFTELFVSYHYHWQGSKGNVTDIAILPDQWKNETFLKNYIDFDFVYRLNGFKKAGINTFDIYITLRYRVDNYWYGFILTNNNNQQPFIKKMYHQQLTPSDIELITNTISDFVMDDIEKQMDLIKREKK